MMLFEFSKACTVAQWCSACGLRFPKRGRVPCLEGLQVCISCKQLYYICFIQVLAGGHWVIIIVDYYNGSLTVLCTNDKG